MPLKRLRQREGSAILVCLILSLLFMGLLTFFQQWATGASRRVVNRMERQRALNYAESGVAEAMDRLRAPSAFQTIKTDIPYYFYNNTLDHGRYDVTITRSGSDSSNAIIFSSAAYYYRGGSQVDSTGQHFQHAAIQVTVAVRSVSDFFAAVPGVLNLAPGTNAAGGSVYGAQVNFSSDPNAAATTLGTAYYFHSVLPNDTPQNVTFTNPSTPQPIKLPLEPTLVRLDSSLRNIYKGWANGASLPVGSTMTGNLADPGGYHVLFCAGDLVLGQPGNDLFITGPVVIYSTGAVVIAGNIAQVGAGAGLVVLAEGNIVLSQTAPSNLSVFGTFVTNGAFYAEKAPPSPARNTFTFTGGFQALGGASFDVGWPNRSYGFMPAPSSVILPYFLDTIEYLVLEGKFNQ